MKSFQTFPTPHCIADRRVLRVEMRLDSIHFFIVIRFIVIKFIVIKSSTQLFPYSVLLSTSFNCIVSLHM